MPCITAWKINVFFHHRAYNFGKSLFNSYRGQSLVNTPIMRRRGHQQQHHEILEGLYSVQCTSALYLRVKVFFSPRLTLVSTVSPIQYTYDIQHALTFCKVMNDAPARAGHRVSDVSPHLHAVIVHHCDEVDRAVCFCGVTPAHYAPRRVL